MGCISSIYYHAGIDSQLKSHRQNDWKQGIVRVMVATNAFGMGIDKSDVRVVIHYDLPPSLEEYYQEAGRVGRDGKPSFAVLLTSKTDKALLHKRITEAFPERPFIKNTYEQICNHLHFSIGEGYEAVKEFNITRFCSLFENQDEKKCRSSLRLLGQAGYMHFIEDAEKRSRMKILCEREELYDVKFPDKKTENVLAMALRLYTGLFTDYVYIHEAEIAFNLKLNQSEVYEALQLLDKMKIVNFIPRTGLPMIYLPTAREEKNSLIIGRNIYEERIEVIKGRTESMIDYAFKDSSCRVKRMLSYFGETNASDCGKCDICREKRNIRGENKKQTDLTGSIMTYLQEHPEGTRFITLESRFQSDKKSLSQVLAYLCNEGYLKLADNLYYLN